MWKGEQQFANCRLIHALIIPVCAQAECGMEPLERGRATQVLRAACCISGLP